MQGKRVAILSKTDLSAKVAQETLLVAKPEPAKLTKEQRSAIARKAAARWSKKE
jgi:hypothetical protein